MPKQTTWRVVVGNIGEVGRARSRVGDVSDLAEAMFRNHVELSKAPCGRASGEDVTLFMNDSVVYWYNPDTQEVVCC